MPTITRSMVSIGTEKNVAAAEVDQDVTVNTSKNASSQTALTNKKRAASADANGANAKRSCLDGRSKDPGSEAIKPSLNPPIWADMRQQLCDALPWFKSHQGGLYTSGKIAKGFLIDSEVGIRDYLDADIIITSVGGGRQKTADGTMERQTDQQCDSTTVVCSRTAFLSKEALGGIVGSGNGLLPVKAPHAYNIMGWFHIADFWPEKEITSTGKTIKFYKMKLEKIFLEEESWWAERSSVIHPGDFTTPKKVCKLCNEDSKQIYAEAWTCLHETCDNYFKFRDSIDINKLTYSANFLLERTTYGGECPGPLVPALPAAPESGGFGTEKSFRVGIVCPQCHGCSRRIFWSHWVYETKGCRFEHRLPPNPIPIGMVTAENKVFKRKQRAMEPLDIVSGFRIPQIDGFQKIDMFILTDPTTAAGVQVKVVGSVTVFRSTSAVNRNPNGPNDLWMQMQTANLGLKRNPARLGGNKNEILTRHFARNYGAPYKFGVAVESEGFDQAPNCVLGALQRLRWAGRHAVQATANLLGADPQLQTFYHADISANFVEFNELLALGYMEEDRINYHDDGEDTLGPTVATMSLGSPSVMAFRVKSRYTEKSGAGNLPGSITLPLCHGDMVVMHGTDIHKFYEHKVEPKGLRRFALTSRNIVINKVAPRDQAEAVRKGTLPARAANFIYNGY